MDQLKTNNRYGPLTKSIDIDETLMLIDLSLQYESVEEWQKEAMFQLPQASRTRRQEIVSAVRRNFLNVERGTFVETPLYTLLTLPTINVSIKQDLLLAQYLRTTPLIWEALEQVVLPHAKSAGRSLGNEQDAEIEIQEWMDFLKGRLNTETESTVVKTRQHITAHLMKFGLLEALRVPGDHIAKRFYARFYEPDPKAFWFSLALEFSEQGWASRSLDYIMNSSWTRIAYCTKPTYVRFAIEEAEQATLISTNYFGSEKQISFRGPDPVTNVVEVIRYG